MGERNEKNWKDLKNKIEIHEQVSFIKYKEIR